jgi:hypothetical protein
MGSFLLWLFLAALYFLPTITAYRRGHRNGNPIFVVNFFFGWTIIGWAVAYAWSRSPSRR